MQRVVSTWHISFRDSHQSHERSFSSTSLLSTGFPRIKPFLMTNCCVILFLVSRRYRLYIIVAATTKRQATMPPTTPPAIAPARLLGEEERLADAVATLMPVLTEEEGANVPLPSPRHSVAFAVTTLKVPFEVPNVDRVPLVCSENIRSEYSEPVGKDGLPGKQEGVKNIIPLVISMPGAMIPSAVSRFGMGWNVSLFLCNSWMLAKVGVPVV